MAIFAVPVTKAKGVVEIDTGNVPEDVYREAVFQGLKVLVNRGASTLKKEDFNDDEAYRAAATEVANKQVAAILAGDIKPSGAPKTVKASRDVMVEARRLAKEMVKDYIRNVMKQRPSHYSPKEMTRLTERVLQDQPSIIETARANIEARTAKPLEINLGTDLAPDPARVEKAKATAAARAKKNKTTDAGTLSATQAGKAKPRAKGDAPRPQAH